MFRKNTKHEQQSFFESVNWMGKRAQKKLSESWAPLFYEHVFTQIDEAPFAVLFCEENGAPNAPINTLLSLEIIKHIKDITDQELMDQYNFDYLVNYAIGQRVLGESSIAERTLYYFRERLYAHTMEHPEAEDLLFGQFKHLLKQFVEKTGHIMDAQRIDTTMFMSNIKKSGRISLAYDVLMRSVKKIPAERLTPTLQEVRQPNFKTDLLYRTKSGQSESRLEQLLSLCREMLDLLEALPEDTMEQERRILRRLLDEQTKVTEDGTVTVKAGKEITSGSLQSAFDEDATYRKKNKVSQSGYVLAITETCSEENPMQFITDYAVEANNTADTTILSERMENIANTGCNSLCGDGGFASADIKAQANAAGITMHYTELTGREPEKAVTAANFTLNESQDCIELCPGGQQPVRTGNTKHDITAHFEKVRCEACEYRAECPHKAQKKDSVVRLSKKSIETMAERRRMKAERVENTSHRAAIEGTNSALKQMGLRKLRVRGKAKCTIVSGLKVIAQNVKRLIKYLQGGYDRAAAPAV
jgi:hypothetical protein